MRTVISSCSKLLLIGLIWLGGLALGWADQVGSVEFSVGQYLRSGIAAFQAENYPTAGQVYLYIGIAMGLKSRGCIVIGTT